MFKLRLAPLGTEEDGKFSRFQRAFEGHRFLTIEIPFINDGLFTQLKRQTKDLHIWLKQWLQEEKLFLDRI
jgi:hypothetical protein